MATHTTWVNKWVCCTNMFNQRYYELENNYMCFALSPVSNFLHFPKCLLASHSEQKCCKLSHLRENNALMYCWFNKGIIFISCMKYASTGNSSSHYNYNLQQQESDINGMLFIGLIICELYYMWPFGTQSDSLTWTVHLLSKVHVSGNFNSVDGTTTVVKLTSGDAICWQLQSVKKINLKCLWSWDCLG